MRRVALLALLCASVAARAPEPPRVVIPWAWERPEDLRFVGGEVAYLERTITLDGPRTLVRLRRQPIRAAHPTPVVRIETRKPSLDDAQLRDAVRAIAGVRGREVQIDFDATRSQRDFYRRLVTALRPRFQRITITALASWCAGDRWLDAMPVDDAIPMLFRTGSADPNAFVDRLRDPRCRASVGIALDEPLDRLPPARRVYVFDPRRWSWRDWQVAQKVAQR